MTFSDLAQWWNLVFVLPFVTALGLLLLMTTGLLATEMGGDMDGDVHADVSHDADDWHGFKELLGFIGVGRIPISIVIMAFCFVWGLSGVVANQILGDILVNPHVFVWPAMGIALVASSFFTSLTSRVMSRLLPSGASYGVSPPQLVGKLATVRFRVTESSGTAQLTDNYGNFHEVSCRVAPGEPDFKQGERVVLMDYDEGRKVFLVRTDPLQEMGLEDPVTGPKRDTPQRENVPAENVPAESVLDESVLDEGVSTHNSSSQSSARGRTPQKEVEQ